MIRLHDKETGEHLGNISGEHLQFLIDNLEEESGRDQDYYIDAATIEMLQARGGDRRLLGILRTALQNREGMEIYWAR
jgi:hypothetical protein